MVKVELTETELVLRMQGADKLWALKSQLTIPLQHISTVHTDSEVVHQWFHGLKLPGSNIPGLLTAGTFYQSGKRVFWDIHHPELAVIITLHDENYNELVIEVEHPHQVVQDILQAIKQK